jgi:predicted Zn finger-like uncharacterized protein
MKFLCPNCKAKYRIGPEKMVGRQAAKIRCRKCEYLIQIAYRGNSDEFDVTATPPSVAPPGQSAVPAPPAPRPPKVAPGQPVALSPVLARPRMPPPLEEGSATKKPTAAVPGLPGLGSAKGTRGAAMFSDPSTLSRRPLAPLPPPPVTSTGIAAVSGFGAGFNPGSSASGTNHAASGAVVATGTTAAVVLPSPPPPRPTSTSTQLGDQFRESVQAGAVDDLPHEGWFVGVNGVPLGPIPLDDLRELANAGHIDRRSLVWREGQGEWRPLGKFPGLVRVIDDGAGPPQSSAQASPLPEPPVSAPAARSNGSNGQHVVTGFDVVRADHGERPSAWGDLDDEDDEDEQPTTVKGRVSVMPPPGALPSASSSFPPPRELPATPEAQNASPYGLTSAVRAVPAPAPAPTGSTTSSGLASPLTAPPVVREGPSLSVAAEPVLDGSSPLRTSGRVRWYLLIAAAVVVAFALGAAAMQWVGSSTPEPPGKSSASSSRAAGGSGGASKPPPPPAKDGQKKAAAPAQPAAGATVAAGGSNAGARVIPVAAAGAPAGPASLIPAPPSKVGSPPGSLLAGIGSPQTPGPGPQGPRNDVLPPVPTPSGLDATAVQRTVRRYSPAVRQNCWQRALSARAAGVPTSAKVSATITIEPSGRVQAVSVAGAPRGYPTLARCIETSVKGWQFPRAASQTVTNVPFMFVGQ